MPDVLIVGGGLAGSAAAITLARRGAAVTLVERSEAVHDKVCGEFLSGEALAELTALGCDPRALGAVPLHAVRACAGGDAVRALLPFPALSVTRRLLDEALLERASGNGVLVLRGVSARTADGGEVRLSDGRCLRPEHLVLATGKHDLRGHRRPAGIHSDLVGLKAYFRLVPRLAADLAGHVDVVFFPGGYLGLQPVESGEANACLVVSKAELARLGGDPWAVFRHVKAHAPHAARLLEGATPTLGKPLAVSAIPYGYVRMRSEGAFHVGDQAAVIPSFCGEGMGIALRSGRLAAEAILAGEHATAFQARFGRLVYARVKGAALLSRALSSVPLQRTAVGAASLAPHLLTALAAATRTPQPSSP
ncbi:NAD(P)/FAD-dependent oxidoreductase [Parvularcula dongshanensis]|uniref:Flavin-dependent dehydrogenase n=1 Tax=Parvularcula dongshanensis TaxID=1173995 RepID=A0A840I6U2_9PROT|nr:FAD-dependent oxidoreductase [Parvularcula dongshanensis]MBB4659884.1 flavin-dependent dehydrogenase [Parvularcula dongshanensis]